MIRQTLGVLFVAAAAFCSSAWAGKAHEHGVARAEIGVEAGRIEVLAAERGGVASRTHIGIKRVQNRSLPGALLLLKDAVDKRGQVL